MFKLGKRSIERLQGVHPDLVRVVERAIDLTTVDFTVLEGLRSPERQQTLERLVLARPLTVATSQAMRSILAHG